MASKKEYYLPKKYPLLVAWYINFVDKLAPNISKWGVPEDEFEEIRVTGDRFNLAQRKAELPNAGKADRIDRNEKANAFRKAVQYVVNAHLRYNKAITNEERIALGIPVMDTTRTPIGIPTTIILFILSVLSFRQIRIDFRSEGNDSKALPYGDNGAVIAYDICDTPPETHKELTRRELATRTPHTLNFEEGESGKKAYVSIARQNEKGQTGPWSPIQSIIVP